jgi:transcriptional regulator with XRE-family HTH domain
MNDKPDRLTKTTGDVIAALSAHVSVLVDRGLVEPDKLRLKIEARKEKAKELIDAGMSQRQAAKALGVDERTVRRDMRPDAAENAAERRTPEPSLFQAEPPIDDAKAAESARERDERRQLRWAATLNLLSVVSALDRQPSHAASVVALYDRTVEQENGEDRLTKERLRQCAEFLAALIEAWED